MSVRLSEDAKLVALPTIDIGGTDSETIGSGTSWETWQDMANFDRVTALVELGPTWNASDDLDVCKLQQATSAAGAGAKDLTTSGSGLDYDSDTPIDAATNQVVLEARADQLDVDNGFRFVRVFVSEAGDTGTDECHGCLILHSARHGKAERHAAAAAGEMVYVTPTVS
jgi:hypothetical protein